MNSIIRLEESLTVRVCLGAWMMVQDFAELNLENASNQDSDKSQPFLTLQNKSETLDRISFERAIQRYPTDPWLNELKSISTFGGAVKSLWDTEYRYRETIIRSDDTLYVLGPVTVEENNVRFHSGKGPYIVSNRENRNVLFRSVCYGAGWLALGLASITASGCFIMRWIK